MIAWLEGCEFPGQEEPTRRRVRWACLGSYFFGCSGGNWGVFLVRTVETLIWMFAGVAVNGPLQSIEVRTHVAAIGLINSLCHQKN